MRKSLLFLPLVACLQNAVHAQICNPAVAPSGLTSTYTPGTGALLQWNAVPGSIGVLIRATLPSGSSVNQRIVGSELDQFLVPDALLSPGTYLWRVQAACSTIPPYDVTPISLSDNFLVGSSAACPASVLDIDGNTYTTVQIGSQCWIEQNLKTDRYRNGDPIPGNLSNSAWGAASSGARAVYDDDTTLEVTYGQLYNGFAVRDPRGLCPTGWHVPTDAEWTVLTDFLGGLSVAGGAMKSTGNFIAGTGLWLIPNTGATNSSGFTAHPGGSRSPSSGNYSNRTGAAIFWSQTDSGSGTGSLFFRQLDYIFESVSRTATLPQAGFSVRCLQD